MPLHLRRSHSKRSDHGRLSLRSALALLAAALVAAAAIVIGVGVASQHHAPQPPPSAEGSVGRRSTNATTPPPSVATTVPLPAVLSASRPISVTIPAIGVHSDLQVLGLDPDGSLQVPQPGPHYDEAAWCDCSPTPGQRGPSVILGHVDSAADGPSVFFKLGALRPGDLVTVARADGSTAQFRITGVRRFSKDNFPTQLVYGNTPDAQLRLITCGGPFDHSTHHYDDNIVAFATLIAPTAT